MKLLIKDIDFSSLGAYQVLVSDERTQADYWTVLQFDENEVLTDALCTCSHEEEGCDHINASKKWIYNHHDHPLHVRFKSSLWNELCKCAAKRIGFDRDDLQQCAPYSYRAYSVTEKLLFTLEALLESSQKWLEKTLFERVKETENTSLKFSRISDEEISLWKEGRPSFNLRYELSFWCDLAKYLFLLQESQAPYEIEFTYSEEAIPNALKVTFQELSLYFYIAFADLQEVIYSLASVKSPLEVYADAYASVNKITYDEQSVRFIIDRDEKFVELLSKHISEENMIEIGEWLYLPKKGFYINQKDMFFKSNFIGREEMEKCLNLHTCLIEKHLQGYAFHKAPVEPSYDVYFDGLDQLHIDAYVYERGDLQRPRSCLFGSWCYIEGAGFYKLEDLFFPKSSTVILKEDISDFVSESKAWLNGIEGFQIHLTSIRAQLSYFLDDQSILHFVHENDFDKSTLDARDFGAWIYIKGVGFYARHSGQKGFFIQDGMQVVPKNIAFFIHQHESELEQIPGFFSFISPIQSVKLKVELLDKSIKITPTYTLREGYKFSDLIFFDEYVYVKNEGFSKTSLSISLPIAYQEEKTIPENEIDFFVASELSALLPYISYLDPRLRKPEDMFLELNIFEKKSEREFVLDLDYRTNDGSLSATTLWQGLHARRRFLFTSIGLLDLQEERFKWLMQLKKSNVHLKTKTFSLSTFELLRLQLSDEVAMLFEKGAQNKLERNVGLAPSFQNDLWNQLCNFQASVPLDISLLKSTLRPYQESGIKWLWFLYTQNLSGLLCDDMGLGKTHQAMALIAAVSAFKGSGIKIIVVCPTSVIYHWQEKLNAFLPHIKVYTLYGSNRDLDYFEKDFDILLTSYGILRSELSGLTKISFELAIFDEVQIAKNYQSQTHKALIALQAKMKLGLTGTPIENRLRELKSLFDLVLPMYMPSEELFRDLFVNPIEKLHDVAAKNKLNHFIKPFVLRRKKGDVLLELPEKTEEEAHAELLEDQAKLYEQTLFQVRPVLESELQDETKSIPYISLFTLLGKLKQICDHPAVFLKDPSRYQEYQSGKWNLFVELLQEALESEQKVVVFSHYLGMLDIMETYLRSEKILFASIRGSTKNREEELRRFHDDPDCKVFLGSLQAVGLGVELTAASVVIHYDRWWNAARENQATDRVYRMGQKRGVQVFKLVTRGTVEEHIAALITKKAGLMEDIIGFDDERLLKQFTRQEWLSIFSLQ